MAVSDRHLPLCANVTGAEPGRWSLADDGYRYSPIGCRLARPSATAARRCLRRRHVLFLGDSLSRYGYLVLAHFLVNGVWPSDEPLLTDRSGKSICSQGPFKEDWNAYYAYSSSLLRGHEVCDCTRAHTLRRGRCKTPEATMTENRYLRVPAHDGGDGGQVSIVSQLCQPEWYPHGDNLLGSYEEMREGMARVVATSCRARHACPNAWRHNISAFMAEALPALGVTDVIFNTGHHWTPAQLPAATAERFMTDIFEAAAAAVRGRGGGAWWRTTSINRRFVTEGPPLRNMVQRPIEPNPEVQRWARVAGLRVLDYFNMTARLVEASNRTNGEGPFLPIDPTNAFSRIEVHFKCSVYREKSILLLNALCSPRELDDHAAHHRHAGERGGARGAGASE